MIEINAPWFDILFLNTMNIIYFKYGTNVQKSFFGVLTLSGAGQMRGVWLVEVIKVLNLYL